jgi:hypothetical protein
MLFSFHICWSKVSFLFAATLSLLLSWALSAFFLLTIVILLALDQAFFTIVFTTSMTGSESVSVRMNKAFLFHSRLPLFSEYPMILLLTYASAAGAARPLQAMARLSILL